VTVGAVSEPVTKHHAFEPFWVWLRPSHDSITVQPADHVGVTMCDGPPELVIETEAKSRLPLTLFAGNAGVLLDVFPTSDSVPEFI